MGANITYMGTKRSLTFAVCEVAKRAQHGVLLDTFSGMCSVGEAVGTNRQIWNNDAQIFASTVATAIFARECGPPSALDCASAHFPLFKKQHARLTTAFKKALKREADLLAAHNYSMFSTRLALLKSELMREANACTLRSPHLFSRHYSVNYFGISQAIEIDAIAHAIQTAIRQRIITIDEARWCIVALGRALLKAANSTGHFAQYLKPKPKTYRRYISLRRRSIWDEWLSSISSMSPAGTPDWRKKNRAFNTDSLALIPRLAKQKAEIGVIYADPPYTDDQYSRFYHLLETLCLYDYPEITGAGLYRAGRFQTSFSLISKAPEAMSKLIKHSARTGADLILSYPENGLARRAGADIVGILKKHFRKVETCFSIPHLHSTFGASKGVARNAATELIYLARS